MIYPKTFLATTLLALALSAQAQNFRVELNHADGREETIRLEDIQEISFENLVEGVDYVDLGLPSGTLWATSAVATDDEHPYGHLFVYGETYPWEYSKVTSSTRPPISPCFGKTVAENQALGIIDENCNLTAAYDAATIYAGSAWRTPTADEWRELIDECEWEEYTGNLNLNNTCGAVRLTGPNSNTLIIIRPYITQYESGVYKAYRGYFRTATLDHETTTGNLMWVAHNAVKLTSEDSCKSYMTEVGFHNGAPILPVLNFKKTAEQ